MRRILLSLLIALTLNGCVGAETETPVALSSGVTSPDARFTVGERVFEDNFAGDLSHWTSELEKPGIVRAIDGALEIDVPGGCTVWLKRPLSGPVLISYDATMIAAGGVNDRVSDLNCFWMARDARSPNDLFATRRRGVFSDYDQLRCYYVGHGGNSNTTTRFRRYIGEKGNRPLRPEHDLTAPEFLLKPNVSQHIQLVAAGSIVAYFRDGSRLFSYDDPAPYTSGWFGLRTVTSHFRIRNFQIHRLIVREEVSKNQ